MGNKGDRIELCSTVLGIILCIFFNRTIIFGFVFFASGVSTQDSVLLSYDQQADKAAGGLTGPFCPPVGFGLELDPTECESEEWKSQSSL